MKAKPKPRTSSSAKVRTSKEPKAPQSAIVAPAKSDTKDKRVEGRFSMPRSDYALIGQLKSTSKLLGRSVKKNELIRAGLRALSAMSADDLAAAVAAVQPIKRRAEIR